MKKAWLFYKTIFLFIQDVEEMCFLLIQTNVSIQSTDLKCNGSAFHSLKLQL